MLLFLVSVLAVAWLDPAHSYPEWKARVSQPAASVLILVFFLALFSHMWVGLRDVLLDYARPAALRRTLLVVVAVGLAGMAAWIGWIFLRLLG